MAITTPVTKDSAVGDGDVERGPQVVDDFESLSLNALKLSGYST